jgi:photosystem II stability/assembly factor-like uncharacterized protein
MNRFQKVIEILDRSVGGPDVQVGFPHMAFWRGLSRDEFVAKTVFGLRLISLGNGPGSILVNALKGEAPFGADIGTPGADFNRMPSGMPAVPDDEIAFIEGWINDGCPEDELVTPPKFIWRKTNAPIASSRTDDIWFIDPQVGWAVNSDGKIIKTTDGGNSWEVQYSAPGLYLRCIGFADANVGWVGTLSPMRRLLRTSNGGTTWTVVSNLPSIAPVKICGMSVVSDQIVYCSGTNDPADTPRMIKTTDGGASWTAWDMSAHASVLIDCFFFDALHGWVVGGKSEEPTPTKREKLKPVVLETIDGGISWTNRLAGQEEMFPSGEWGWKIQFLDQNIGFVSLENFNEAAILKTIDGGVSWTRMNVEDPQSNVNLEGVGFIDEKRGWVGGWGPGGFNSPGFPKGFSSATTDGGRTWMDANEIGLYINRFRFLGQPVSVGYAAGDTVYKYSSDPIDTSKGQLRNETSPARSLLPDIQLTGNVGKVLIPINIPAGAQRASLIIWDRFGAQVGCVLDEVHPASGHRIFEWDTCNVHGRGVNAGDYLVRLIVDDESASSRLTIAPRSSRVVTMALPSSRRSSIAPRMPFSAPRQSRFATLAELVNAPDHDIEWLRDALQIAIQLELSTLPPYLLARWSIISASEPISETIRDITREEMEHMGLACNMLSAINGTPLIADSAVAPTYPGALPWGIRPGLVVSLRKLDKAQAGVFMEIEYPQGGPVAAALTDAPTTIGEFYDSIRNAFHDLNPTFTTLRQVDQTDGVFIIDSLAAVDKAITTINLQGEGSNISPEESPGKLAHYYQFGEIFNERRFRQDSSGRWDYRDDHPMPLPAIHDVADIPAGGYQRQDVPDLETWDLIERFDREYSIMLRLLQTTWTVDQNDFWQSLGKMTAMRTIAKQLVTKKRPDGRHYGPCFRYVS